MDSSSHILIILKIVEISILTIGVIAAGISVYYYKKTEKLKATLKMSFQLENDSVSRAGVDILRFIQSEDKKGVFLAKDYANRKISIDKLDKKNLDYQRIEQARNLFAYLNLLEAMCTGIAEKIYDENICKKRFYSKIVKGWNLAQLFINESRKYGGHTIYQEFETIAKRWKNKPLKAKF